VGRMHQVVTNVREESTFEGAVVDEVGQHRRRRVVERDHHAQRLNTLHDRHSVSTLAREGVQLMAAMTSAQPHCKHGR
jgi:hypothetical protein